MQLQNLQPSAIGLGLGGDDLAAEAIGQTPALIKSGRHTAEFYQKFWATLGSQGYWHGEFWNRRRDGQEFAVATTVSAASSGA